MSNKLNSTFYPPQATSVLKDQLQRLIDLSMKTQGVVKLERDTSSPYWDEKFFNLDQSKIWNEFNSKDKKDVLNSLSQDILSEAILIEISGMFYGSKMNHLSESLEERVMFSFITQEEAKHLQFLLPFSDKVYPNTSPSFPLFISQLIENEEKLTALILIQVILEGWGINYYSTLKNDCQSQNLSSVLKSILIDETRHHSCGVVLSKKENPQLTSELQTIIASLCSMIQIGPYNVVKNCFSKKGFTSPRVELQTFLSEIEASAETQKKLSVIEKQCKKIFSEADVETLKNAGVFTPYTEDEMTAFMYEDLDFLPAEENHQNHL